MSKPRRRRPPSRRSIRPPAGARSLLATLFRDPAYLSVKEQLGEPLSPAERAILDAARGRAEPEPRREGGAS